MKFEVVVFVSVLLLFILRMLIYRILERKPKPLKNLICVVTGGAGEIGQVVSILNMISLLNLNCSIIAIIYNLRVTII